MSWTLKSIATEAQRNVRSDRGRTMAHIAGWTVIVAAIVGAELTTIADLNAVATERAHDGIAVAISTADGGITSDSCSRLDQQPHVQAAGGITETGIASFDNLPNAEFVTATATNRALQVLDPTLDTSQLGETTGTVYIGQALSDELGLTPGEVMPLNGQQVTVAGVLATTPRSERVDRWLLTTGPPIGTTDQCWVEYTPSAAPNRVSFNAAALTVESESQLETHELIQLDERSRNLTSEFQQRQLATGWPAAAALGLFVTTGALWSRRSEFALYRTVGLSTTKMMLLVQIETAIALLIATITGALIATATIPLMSTNIANGYTLEQLAVAARTLGLVTSAAFIATPFFVVLLGRNTMTLLKDR